jgi:hypothetical protein
MFQRNVDGTILDFNAGAGLERTVGSQLSLFAGVTFNYVRNTSDQSENGTSTSRFTGGTTTSGSTRTFNGTVTGLLMSLPLGAEYAFSKGLAFRGGIMPEYLSTTFEDKDLQTSSQPQNQRTESTRESNDKSLRFRASLGASIYDEELGVLHAAYGTTDKGFQAWSVSLRFYP